MKKESFQQVPAKLFGSCYTLNIMLLLLFPFLLNNCTEKGNSKNNANKIVVEATISKYFYRELKDIFTIKDEIDLRYHLFPQSLEKPSPEYIPGRVIDGKVKWILYSDHPIRVIPPFGAAIIMKPGDSIHIQYQRNNPEYSGKNMEALALLDTLMLQNERIPKPRKKYSYNADRIEDFLEWNQYLDHKLARHLSAIESFKYKISSGEYEYYKADIIGNIESERINAFGGLYKAVRSGHSNLTNSNLIQIWDSTQNKPSREWLMSLTTYYGSIYDIYTFAWMEIHRQAGFDFTDDSLQSKDVYTRTVYNNAKQKYHGQLRERLMVRILDEEVIMEMGLKNPTTQTILKDYYSQPGYSEYKAWVKGLEKKEQQRELEREKKKKDKEEG